MLCGYQFPGIINCIKSLNFRQSNLEMVGLPPAHNSPRQWESRPTQHSDGYANSITVIDQEVRGKLFSKIPKIIVIIKVALGWRALGQDQSANPNPSTSARNFWMEKSSSNGQIRYSHQSLSVNVSTQQCSGDLMDFNWMFPSWGELFLCNRITPECQSLYNWIKTDSFSTTSTRRMKSRSSTFSKSKMSGRVQWRGRQKIRRFGASLIWARGN